MQAPTAFIYDVGMDDFQARVMEASMQAPVIVDFWAPWCTPCKQLMPLLEKAVTAAGGAVILAKINIDEQPQLAAAMRVQSVPTIYAFFQGQPVDAFQGNLPESQIKAFVAKLQEISRQARPGALDIPEALKTASAALAQKDIQAAHAIYTQILQEDRDNAQAYAGMVRTFIVAGKNDKAKQLIDTAPENIQKSAAYAEAKTALALAESSPVGGFSDLQEKLEKKPDDHQTRFDLANAQFSAGTHESAIDNLLIIVEKDRSWNEDGARKQLLKYFEALGHNDPLTIAGRKKLSSLLFS